MRPIHHVLVGALTSLLWAGHATAAVDVNQATIHALKTVEPVTPRLAKAIVVERQKGPFKDWNDLIARVGGVGERSAQTLSDAGLLVQGNVYVGKASTPPSNPAPQATPVTPPKDAAAQPNTAPAVGAQAPAVGTPRPDTGAASGPTDKPAPAGTSPDLKPQQSVQK